MAGRDGLSLIRFIRAQQGIRQPRIVIQSASAFESERGAALSAGADDFLRKPLDQEQLFAVIEHLLGLHFLREVSMPSPARSPASPPVPPAATAAAHSSAAALPSADDLSLLDASLRADLREAVATLNGQRINRLLLHIESAQPALAPRIRQMLDRAEHQHLWKILG